jgi:hypothetical protein
LESVKIAKLAICLATFSGTVAKVAGASVVTVVNFTSSCASGVASSSSLAD